MTLTREELNEKCADCGHIRESHDYSGCLCWINADSSNKCLCKVWRKSQESQSMKLSQAATEYLILMGQMFKARLDGMDEDEILDKLDEVWNRLTEEELTAMKAISKALGPIMSEV